MALFDNCNGLVPSEAFNKFASVLDDQRYLSRSQLKWALVYLYGKKPNDIEIEKVLAGIKPHRESRLANGEVTLQEFQQIVMVLSDSEIRYKNNIIFEPSTTHELSKETFELLEDFENEGDQKGFISIEDFKTAVRQLLPDSKYENLEGIFMQIDSNKDGKVTFKDFIDLLKFKF